MIEVAAAALGLRIVRTIGGSMFGLILVFLHQTGDGSGVWPVLIMRFVSTPWMAMLIMRSRPSFADVRANRATVLGSRGDSRPSATVSSFSKGRAAS